MNNARMYSPSTQRNQDPILAVLRRVLPLQGLVLELNCGTGEHAAYFARQLTSLTWQSSDIDPVARASAAAHAEAAALPNLRPPCETDATWPEWPVTAAAAILSINMVHIAPWAAFLGLLDGAARTLTPGEGVLFMYGPFKRAGTPIAPSNEQFDRSLQSRNPQWGLRDLDDVIDEAARRGLHCDEVVEMPANNLSVIFSRIRSAIAL
jgi:SAM-dependent methyltransferase